MSAGSALMLLLLLLLLRPSFFTCPLLLLFFPHVRLSKNSPCFSCYVYLPLNLLLRLTDCPAFFGFSPSLPLCFFLLLFR